MKNTESFQKAAEFLWKERKTGQQFAPIPEAFRPLDVEDAYGVQDKLRTFLMRRQGTTVAGYKVALTTPVMQSLVGFHEPVFGTVMANTVHHSPVDLHRSSYGRLGIECEIAVRLGDALPISRAPFIRNDVVDVIDTAMAAFEIVDDRNADYTKISENILTLVADNAWNAGVVLGEPMETWQTMDLTALHGTMRINNEVVGEGYGRDVLGDPLEAATWVLNALAARKIGVSEGAIISTGSVISTKFVEPGDIVDFSLGALGNTTLRVQ